MNDRRDLFVITVEPASREAVTITLPGGRACDTSGAICTKGGEPAAVDQQPGGDRRRPGGRAGA